MNAERVPKHGKADAAFAGAQLSDAWLAIMSIFVALVAGSIFGWVAYGGIPVLGYFSTKAYIAWKTRNLPGHFRAVLYRHGLFGGYSRAFDRKRKLFLGDSKVANPNALQMGAILRAEAPANGAVGAPEISPIEDAGAVLVN